MIEIISIMKATNSMHSTFLLSYLFVIILTVSILPIHAITGNYTLEYTQYKDNTSFLPRAFSSITTSKFDTTIPFYVFGGYYCTSNISFPANDTIHWCSFYNDLWEFSKERIEESVTIENGSIVANYTTSFGSYSLSKIDYYVGDSASLPSGRAFHSIDSITSESGGYLALVGGSVLQHGSDSGNITSECWNVASSHELSLRTKCHRVSPDMFYLYDIRTSLWINMTEFSLASGFVARSSHSSLYYTELLYILGGLSENGTFLNDFWSFDIENLEWILLSEFIGEPRWMAHALRIPTYYTSFLIHLIGGCSSDTLDEATSSCSEVPVNDTWAYSVIDDEWVESVQISEVDQPHLMASIVGARSVVRMDYFIDSDHMFQYNPSTYIWERIDITNIQDIVTNTTTPPFKMLGHSAVYYGDQLVLIGGYSKSSGNETDILWNTDKIYNIYHS
jgi:hypothetical protein